MLKITIRKQYYRVKKGDTFISIARHYGYKNWMDIYNSPLNAEFRIKRRNPNRLRVGDTIILPAKSDIALNDIGISRKILILERDIKRNLENIDRLHNTEVKLLKELEEQIRSTGNFINLSDSVLLLTGVGSGIKQAVKSAGYVSINSARYSQEVGKIFAKEGASILRDVGTGIASSKYAEKNINSENPYENFAANSMKFLNHANLTAFGQAAANIVYKKTIEKALDGNIIQAAKEVISSIGESTVDILTKETEELKKDYAKFRYPLEVRHQNLCDERETLLRKQSVR